MACTCNTSKTPTSSGSTNSYRVFRGDTFSLTLSFVDSTQPACADGTFPPLDLTGATGRAWLVAALGDAVPAATFTVIIDEAMGKVTISLDAATTAPLTPGTFYFDFELTLADGTVQTYLNPSTLLVQADITA